MDDINEKELSAIKNLRNRITDIELDWWSGHNSNLIRWLRARELNVDKAEYLLRKHMEWRKTFKVDSLLSQELRDDMLDKLPFQVPGFDKGGDLVAFIPYGIWDFKELVETGQKDELVNYIYYIIEMAYLFLRHRSTKENKIYNKLVLVLDLEGFSLKQVLHKPTIEFLLGLLQNLEDNHPEVLKGGYLINVPKIFEILWAIAKPLMTARTLSKVDITGCNPGVWRAKLLNHIDADILPSQYGGANTTCQDNVSLYQCALEMNRVKDFKLKIRANRPLPESNMEKVVIEAGSKFEKYIEVPDSQYILRWAFKTENYDIGFTVRNTADEKIVNISRVDANKNVQLGTHKCSSGGSYLFSFDNSYSRFWSKTLHYTIIVCDPGDCDEHPNDNDSKCKIDNQNVSEESATTDL